MKKSIPITWQHHLLFTLFGLYFYLVMEWLFLVTKPSFMSTLSFKDSILILFVSPIPLVLISLVALTILFIASRFWKNDSYRKALAGIGLVIPSIIFSVTVFLLIDNFTYTIFRFGVITTKGITGLAYMILFLFLFAYFYFDLARREKRALISPPKNGKFIFALSLPLLSVIAFFATQSWSTSFTGLQKLPSGKNFELKEKDNRNVHVSSGSSAKHPNIVLIATDGLDAERMSAYGYERNTTPFIKEFIKRKALFCENAFSNATISAPSIASMLTGKLPTKTRLYYPPDILRGLDAYQHLPGLLRGYGYRNIDFGIRYYADAFDLNMLNSFDESNFRKPDELEWISFLSSVFDNNTRYFLSLLMERLKTRFLRVTCRGKIVNPYDVVTGKEVISYSNESILERFLDFVHESNAPFFAHIHLMGTHGPKFYIRNPVFSKGQEQDDFMMDDFFDDAVLEFDRFFESLVRGLESCGEASNTIFVIHTDHSMQFEVINRLPLIFIFPDETYAGIISSNVQNLDIPVTLLDYLGLPVPPWMQGQSLISEKVSPLRPIFVASHVKPKWNEKGLLSANKSFYSPPYYNLGKLFMVICDRCFALDLRSGNLSISRIKDHTSPCSDEEVPDRKESIRKLYSHLRENGYDTKKNREK